MNKEINTYLSLKDISETSKDTYRERLQNFNKYLKKVNIHFNEVTHKDMLAWKKQAIKKYSEHTLNNLLIVINDFYKWYGDNNNSFKNPAEKIHKIKIHKRFFRYPLTYIQSAKLFDLECNDLYDKRDKAMAMLMLLHGLRCKEVAKLDIADIGTRDEKKVLSVLRKGSTHKREILLSQASYNFIQDYLNDIQFIYDRVPLFVSFSDRNRGKRLSPGSVSRIINELLIKTQIKKPQDKSITAHSLRHTCAYLAIKNGENIYDVQALMDHKSITTTEIYTVFSLDEKRENNKIPGRIAESLTDPRKRSEAKGIDITL